MNKKGDFIHITSMVVSVLVVIFIMIVVFGVYQEQLDKEDYYRTCNKCRVIEVQSASAGGWGHSSEYIYKTDCGVKLSYERLHAGDKVCRKSYGDQDDEKN